MTKSRWQMFKIAEMRVVWSW